MTSHGSQGRALKSLVLATALLASLSACRESEEHRQIKLEKGGYAGNPDQALSEDTVRTLQHRGKLQQN